jgi:hypothetical protein
MWMNLQLYCSYRCYGNVAHIHIPPSERLQADAISGGKEGKKGRNVKELSKKQKEDGQKESKV